MLRSIALALATLLLALPPLALGQTTATSESGIASCVEPAGASASTPAVASTTDPPPGATPVSDTATDLTSSANGGTGSTSASVTPAAASVGEDASTGAGDVPLVTVAQEPEPDPEGPGEQQPEEPGGEPQPPTGEEPTEVPGGEAPATGGGLPRTGLEALRLALLGLVLLLVGARLRVILKRRRARADDDMLLAEDGLPDEAPTVVALDPRPSALDPPRPLEEEDVHEDDAAYERLHSREDTQEPARDEWSFPDPDEPAPTGLLPSTATAKRRARLREEERI
jgi:hypothetical protein